jgi:hypothetical protein
MTIKIGSTIGNWIVLSEKYLIGKTYFNDCECICGTKRPVRTWHLLHSMTKGCRCTNIKGRYKFNGYCDLSSSYYNSFKKHRIKKGFKWDDEVTIEFLWNLYIKQNKKCAISGVPIILIKNWSEQNKSKKLKIYQTASIDRIDSDGGYTVDNIQWVHKSINYMKGQLSNDEFIDLCKLIVNNNKRKNKSQIFHYDWRNNLKINK